MKDRRTDPLKQWKINPIDAKAIELWRDYSKARDEMLARTHNAVTPWTVVRADDKRKARLNLIRNMLARLHYGDKRSDILVPDKRIVFKYDRACPKRGMLQD